MPFEQLGGRDHTLSARKAAPCNQGAPSLCRDSEGVSAARGGSRGPGRFSSWLFNPKRKCVASCPLPPASATPRRGSAEHLRPLGLRAHHVCTVLVRSLCGPTSRLCSGGSCPGPGEAALLPVRVSQKSCFLSFLSRSLTPSSSPPHPPYSSSFPTSFLTSVTSPRKTEV